MTAFTGVDSQNLPDVMVSVQFILAIGDYNFYRKKRLFPPFQAKKENAKRRGQSCIKHKKKRGGQAASWV
ncbi:hypothetical protein LOB18_07200 [Lactobacillus delbrueckii subsp. lactis]|nr:hypothetical protein [Lactobacillus delbrueckii subsp. lactis]